MQKRWANPDKKTLALINKFFQEKKADLNFNGSTYPEIFVGRYGYPNVNLGLLTPPGHLNNVGILSSASKWYKNNLSLNQVIKNRSSLIYSRFESKIKYTKSKFLNNLQELAMAKQQADIEVELIKKPKFELKFDFRTSPLTNYAPLKKVVITENIKISRRVEYIVSDTDCKSVEGLKDLYNHGIHNESLIKLLSAGLLGINRKLVPTRWSITAIDDTLSKDLIHKIKNYQQINNYLIFNCEYLGNHYEIILIPRHWSFEVLELDLNNGKIWHDHEGIFKRKTYASSVTGGYYAVRLAICEYLEQIKKQASVLVLREIKPCYSVPLGVGILRESVRDCFNKKPSVCSNLNEAFNNIKERLISDINFFINKSEIIKFKKNQKTLNSFIITKLPHELLQKH